MKKIRQFEKKRGSRLITIIHRQEAIAFLNIPLTRYINIEDSEQVLRAIRLTPEKMPIDILLHTPGGLVPMTGRLPMRYASIQQGYCLYPVRHVRRDSPRFGG